MNALTKNSQSLAIVLLLAVSAAGCGGGDRTDATSSEAAARPAHAGAGHGDEIRHVELTPDQIKAAAIGLATAGPGRIREILPLYGVIAPNAEHVREVAARFPGVIRTVARQLGDTVRQGEAMATVESNESLQTYAVTAPLSGVVTARNANPGEQTGDKTLFTVADLSSVWVELSLFPRDVAKVRLGQSVRVTSTDTGLAATGKVIYVAPFGSSASQTLTARVLLDNSSRRWAPGLYVTAAVTLAESQVPVAVRSGAIQSLDGGSVVFVRSDEGFEPRSVRIGRSDGENSEVLEGIEPGETYAASNSFILKAEIGKGEAAHED